MSRTVLLAVSLLKRGLRLAMSEIEPSTRWPPLTTFCVAVVAGPPPQAARNSMPPVRKAVKARAPPMPRRTSRRDQSCRKRSNCSDSRSELVLLLTYILHDVIAALRLVRIMQGTSLPDKSLRFAPPVQSPKSSAQAGVKRIPDCVPEQVGRQHGDEDTHPRQEYEPDRVCEVLLGVAQHVAPAGRWRVNAEAEVVQRSLGQDHAAHAEAGGDDQHRQGVGQQVAQDQPQVTGAERARCQHEVAVADREHLPPDQPGGRAPADRSDHQRQADQAGRAEEEDADQDEQKQARDREYDVD